MSEPAKQTEWLREARASYLRSADQKTDDLLEAISALEDDPSDPGARQHLHMLLHNLVGSGASYGFPNVSVIARRLSSALKRANDERMIVESGLVALLRNGVGELREAFVDKQDGMS